MGRVLIETGRSEDAVSEFTRALDLGQRSGMAYEGLAEAYAQLGQTDRAEAAYRSMLSRRRNDWRAYHQLALFYKRQGDLPGAIREYQHVIALTPDNAMAYSNLGGFYYIAGQFAEAREMWEKSRSIEPTRAALTNLAQLQMNDEQYEQALETYLQVIELDPNNYRAWTNVGVAYGRVGLSSEATQARWNSIRLAKDLLARNPQHIGALTFLAHEFAVDRDREKSLDLLERAERIAGDDPGAWVGLAQAYAELGRNEKARVCLQKALDLGYSIEALRQKQGLQPVLEKWNFETELP